jgi:hypothetical protein
VNPRTLLAILLLLPAASATGTEPQATLGPAEAAAVEVLRGNAPRARAILASIKGAKSDPGALVVLACLALEDGFTKDAETIAGRLRTLRPEAAEGFLLQAIAKERAAHPRGDWLSAGLTALTSVRPLPASSPIIDAAERIPLAIYDGATPFPEEKASTLRPADSFVARWAWPREPQGKPGPQLVDAAIRFANADERPLVHLVALDVLESTDVSGDAARAEAIGAARRAIVASLRDTPAGRRRLIGLMSKKRTEPVEEREVVAFEAAVAEAAPPSYAAHFAELYRILRVVDRSAAGTLAFGGAVSLSITPPFIIELGDRLKKGGLSSAMKERLASALVRWADQEQDEGIILGDMIAGLALTRAGDLRRDASLKTRAYAIKDDSDRFRDALRCLRPLLQLPLPSLHEAWARQGPAERVLAQQVMRMGLSCPEPAAATPEPAPATTEPTRPCPDDAPAKSETR